MENYIEEINKIPIIDEVDVLVCGGGPAGIGAAIRAARLGVSVMIIESQGCLGGIATAGMMSHWGGRSSSKIMTEIWDLTYAKAQEVGWCNSDKCGKNAIYHEVQKVVLDEMLEEAELLDFLKKRLGIIDGVVFTGGEPLLHSEILDLFRKIKFPVNEFFPPSARESVNDAGCEKPIKSCCGK